MQKGWYSPDLELSSGTVGIEYWNNIVNRYSPRGVVNPNDVTIYTQEHYIASLMVYLDQCQAKGVQLFVDLPIGQVWDMSNWEPATWTPAIVSAVHTHPALAGFYIGDEPEVWGYSSANVYPILNAEFMSNRYKSIKAITEKPALVVFVDPPLIRNRYGSLLNPKDRFFDIFGFDYYPFDQKKKLNWDRVAIRLEEMKTLWEEVGEPPLMYVGQGCGNITTEGQPNFGQRNPDSTELDEMLARVKGLFGTLDYYLLWSWQYADHYMRTLGNVHLETVTEIKPVNARVGWLRKLIFRIFGI